MSTDYEMLELAAKAAGIPRQQWDYEFCRGRGHMVARGMMWNPLTDDGSALRLAVKLRVDIDFEKLHTVSAWCAAIDDWVTEYCDDGMGVDILIKTRRAIVRAAAEIGKAMP